MKFLGENWNISEVNADCRELMMIMQKVEKVWVENWVGWEVGERKVVYVVSTALISLVHQSLTWCIDDYSHTVFENPQKKSHSTLRAFTFWVDKNESKIPKMVHFGEFLKLEVCGQTVLPDRSFLIGKTLVKNAKIT